MSVIGETWFLNKGWKPHRFQKETWDQMAKGKSGLLNAPTGSGKTFALWFGVLENYYRTVFPITKKRHLHCLWITPLRALSKEIAKATQEVSDDLALDYTIELRTGDTSSYRRQQQRTKPPHCFITTPESVHLLLANKGYSEFFEGIKVVVVDEWHELMGSKRGVQVELALSRLRAMHPNLIVWGISATIGNIELAQEMLVGDKADNAFVKANITKRLEIRTLLPDTIEKYPWAGHLGKKLTPKVVQIIHQHQSTLVFTNTRAQAELWYQQILDEDPSLAGLIAIHHGAMGEEIRTWVEDSLHTGILKAVVCTSSLDLGVDFKPVDCVIQIGSPKGVARLMQRAGRSGHSPGALSLLYFAPTHSLEILEGVALKRAVKAGIFEQRLPYIASFDVLIQYMMTLAVSEGFAPDELFQEVKTTHAFATITRDQFDECVLMLTQGGRVLQAYEEFYKVGLVEGKYHATSRKAAMRHRLSIGTIVTDPSIRVVFKSGGYLGTIDEGFIASLKEGEAFWFAGRLVELQHLKELTATVVLSKKKKGKVPTWQGGRISISTHYASILKEVLTEAQNITASSPAELRFLSPLLQLQKELSALPNEGVLLVEYLPSKTGFHLFVYPFEGKLVHEGMAAIIAHRLSQYKPASFTIASNEYGFEVVSDTDYPIEQLVREGLFSSQNLWTDIHEEMNISELAKRRFRDVAGIAGLIFKGMPGKEQKTKHLQANSGLFFKVFTNYDPDNLLLQVAYDEVYRFQLEWQRLEKAFQTLEHLPIQIKRPSRLTPFSFPIFAESFRERYTNDSWKAQMEKMQSQLE